MSRGTDKTEAYFQAYGFKDATGETLYAYRMNSAAVTAGGLNTLTHGLATGIYSFVNIRTTGVSCAAVSRVSGTTLDIVPATACTVEWLVFGTV